MNFDKFDPTQVTGMELTDWLWSLPNCTDLRILNTGPVLGLCNPKTNEVYLLVEKSDKEQKVRDGSER